MENRKSSDLRGTKMKRKNEATISIHRQTNEIQNKSQGTVQTAIIYEAQYILDRQ